ncbi:hypothetical protein INR49_029928 [Caranx melampygus]|nr:hypothetical protein INR49_029928 [Caranx melampygus]
MRKGKHMAASNVLRNHRVREHRYVTRLKSTSCSLVLNGVCEILCLGEGQGEYEGEGQGEEAELAKSSSDEWRAAGLARRQRGLHHSFWPWPYSLICKGGDLDGTRGGGDDIPALASSVPLLIFGQQRALQSSNMGLCTW